MNFEFSPDQAAMLEAIDKLAARYRVQAAPQRYEYAPALWDDLMQAGFFESARIDELGIVAATAMVMAVSQVPVCVELTASALLAPMLGDELPGPFAVVCKGREGVPTRFLPAARTVIRFSDTGVDIAAVNSAEVQPLESLFAYPMGVLRQSCDLQWTALPVEVSRVRTLYRVGIAAEIVGSLDAAMKAVLEHVRDRRQFGRPLGSFQAIQHRLAECAILVEGARWLVMRAAGTGCGEHALLALGQAQRISTRVSYDLHQFMGAMGLTLEHPLHRWTYRTKLLRSELGGAERQFIAAADARWGPARATTNGASTS